jgi:hypothetical protein
MSVSQPRTVSAGVRTPLLFYNCCNCLSAPWVTRTAALLVLALLASAATALVPPSAASQELAPNPVLIIGKGTIVSREPSRGAWLLEFDRGVEMPVGRVRSVRLAVDENRGPAHPIGLGDRLLVEGRLFLPVLPGSLSILEPARIEQLSDPGLRHAYFLFRSGPSDGCAECYIPLLLTTTPIDESTAVSEVEVIVTFERDSIWSIPDGLPKISEVQPGARTLRFNDRRYRYQEVSPEEAIRLLKNPLGSLPISRPFLTDAPTLERRRALLFRLGVREP